MTSFFRIAALIALTVAAGTSVAAQAEIARFDARTKTYCVRTAVTGSIIPQRICASRQQWIDGGATIVATTPKLAAQVAAR